LQTPYQTSFRRSKPENKLWSSRKIPTPTALPETTCSSNSGSTDSRRIRFKYAGIRQIVHEDQKQTNNFVRRLALFQPCNRDFFHLGHPGSGRGEREGRKSVTRSMSRLRITVSGAKCLGLRNFNSDAISPSQGNSSRGKKLAKMRKARASSFQVTILRRIGFHEYSMQQGNLRLLLGTQRHRHLDL
jgi:hypothetical protein